jgi:hypothetical protein
MDRLAAAISLPFAKRIAGPCGYPVHGGECPVTRVTASVEPRQRLSREAAFSEPHIGPRFLRGGEPA